jgi:hypothetical protein
LGQFLAYNTDDPNATAMDYTPLGSDGSVTVGPIETGVATKIAGSVYSDQNGTFEVQQCFDYWLPGNATNSSPHFDVVASYTVDGGTPVTIDEDVIAPVLQIVYTNGGTAQDHLRIFCRVFGTNRG